MTPRAEFVLNAYTEGLLSFHLYLDSNDKSIWGIRCEVDNCKQCKYRPICDNTKVGIEYYYPEDFSIIRDALPHLFI